MSQALADGVATTGTESQGGRLLGRSTMSCQSRTSHVISCRTRRFQKALLRVSSRATGESDSQGQEGVAWQVRQEQAN